MTEFLQGVLQSLPATVAGLARPRQPTGAELAAITFTPPPPASGGVRVRALVQSEWSAPTAGVIEGQFTPPTTRLAMSAFLVEHESGMFLADAGVCADAHTRHLAEMPTLVRKVLAGPPPRMGLADAIGEAGVDPAQLQFALLTHAHWDHVSGLAELPQLLARVSQAEQAVIAEVLSSSGATPGFTRASLRDIGTQPVPLDGPPVLTFPASADVFGDGTVMLCDLAGHTPGHVGILLTLRSGRRILLAGDAVWNSTQIRLSRQRPTVAQLVDADPDAAYRTLLRLGKLPGDIVVIPAHDHATINTTFGDSWLE